MPRTVEVAFNNALANVLRGKHPRWRDRITAEQTGVIRDSAGSQPDIVVRHPGGTSVVIETEYEPARTAEQDAQARLGTILEPEGQLLEAALAVCVPGELGEGASNLEDGIRVGTFRFCTFSGARLPGNPVRRWPRAGWLQGGIDELVDCVEQISLSEETIAEGADLLERTVRNTARQLRLNLADSPDALRDVARCLRQEDCEQTIRMAMAILLNAFIFQTAVAGSHGIPDPSELRGPRGTPSKVKVLDCWQEILTINYWPIFSIARDLLVKIPDREAPGILSRLSDAASDLADIGATTLNDLSGAMFQRLIADRKFLATFYTLPSSAHLLAELAVARLDVDWTNPDDTQRLRIADFACGTGALIAAVYHRVAARHRRAGRDDRELHKGMMEKVLHAADIMPAATHLTASIVSSVHPTATFDATRIYTMPYGARPEVSDRVHAIGSLDLLSTEETRPLFGTGATETRGTGQVENIPVVDAPDGTFDLVIMNPPFTRPTNHESTTIPVPSFAGFDTSRAEQAVMSKCLRAYRKNLDQPVGHGNAGLASNFIDLAHRKLRNGGVAAFVLPAAFAQGESWSDARRLFASRYRQVTVVSIATTGQTDRAFSADTGMAEVLVVGTKSERGAGETLFANLRKRPQSIIEAIADAKSIAEVGSGPPTARAGPIPLTEVDEAGVFVRTRLDNGGAAGIVEPGLAETMLFLVDGKLKLPRLSGSVSIPVTCLDEIGRKGPLHRDLNGDPHRSPPRGPFDIRPLRAGSAPTYPTLWAHDATQERRMLVEPDRRAEPRSGCEERAAAVWRSHTTRLHFNLDFRVNSQSLAACLTPEETLGGRAWPNFKLQEPDWEAPIVLWANTTLGVTLFWWRGSRQQQGRTILTHSTLPRLTVLDPRELSDTQLDAAATLLAEFSLRELRPANEAFADKTRQALDRAVLLELLGLPEEMMESLDLFRRQWCMEPSVHGGKSTRPPITGVRN